MAIHKYLRKAYASKESKELYKERMIQWRREPVTVRTYRPLRLDRARAVGYKAQEGFVVVRQRVNRGGHMRPQLTGGRRTAHSHRNKNLAISYQSIAERRAQAKYENLTVLNSYLLCKDGQRYWYEIILINPTHPNIIRSDKIGAARKKGRVERGLTRAGRRNRGQAKKSNDKAFPSKRAIHRRRYNRKK